MLIFAGSAQASDQNGNPVVAAAGDIACAGPFSRTAVTCHHGDVADRITADPTIDRVLPLGDIQYECGSNVAGSRGSFGSSYDPTWGVKFNGITLPTPGNHEYQKSTNTAPDCDNTSRAGGYFSYFNGGTQAAPDFTGCSTTWSPTCPAGTGYYSVDLGTWHIVSLNTNCGKQLWSGQMLQCWWGSPDYTWLKNDLLAWKQTHPSPSCVAVIGHHPRFSSGEHGDNVNQHAFWTLFYNQRVDVVLNGHDHLYERFAPQRSVKTVNPDGTKTYSAAVDPRGRASSSPVSEARASIRSRRTQPNRQFIQNSGFGFLRMVLKPVGYDWQFVSETGVVLDSGTASCV